MIAAIFKVEDGVSRDLRNVNDHFMLFIYINCNNDWYNTNHFLRTFKTERQRKREGASWEAVVRDTTFNRGKKNNISPFLKVPRQCWLVFLVLVFLREGNELGS
jgi:hypothetical protein